MNFGKALEIVKKGGQVRRPTWGDKQFVYLNPGSTAEKLRGRERIAYALDKKLFEQGHEGTATRLPNLNLAAGDGSTQTGWVASQLDMLAEDWEAIE